MNSLKQASARALTQVQVPAFLASKKTLQRENLAPATVLAHAMADGDSSGGAGVTAGNDCDPTTKNIAMRVSAQAAVDAGFPPLEQPSDFQIILDWADMPDEEKQKGLDSINLVAPQAASLLGYGACNLQAIWSPLDMKTMTTNTPNKGALWKVVIGQFNKKPQQNAG